MSLHYINQNVTTTTCPNCKEPIFTTNTIEPGPTTGTNQHRIDPTPITKQQEIGCILTNRSTWTLEEQSFGTRIGLWLRSPEYFEDQHDPTLTEIVLPAHKCGARFNTGWTPKTLEQLPDEPPF